MKSRTKLNKESMEGRTIVVTVQMRWGEKTEKRGYWGEVGGGDPRRKGGRGWRGGKRSGGEGVGRLKERTRRTHSA